MAALIARLRWWIARQANRNPRRCWADLVSWAHAYPGYKLRRTYRTPGCTEGAIRNGRCYCGKLGRDGAIVCGTLGPGGMVCDLEPHAGRRHEDDRCSWWEQPEVRRG